MENKNKTDFCIECRKITEYILKKEMRTKIIKDKKDEYETMAAYCLECGEEMSIPGLLDYDIKAFDNAYREKENITTVDIKDKSNI